MSRRTLMARRYWLVGASAGLGRAIARELSGKGVELVLSARNREELESLAKELPSPAYVAPCDVRDRATLEAALSSAGQIDGLIFCAGIYDPLGALEWDSDKIEAMCDVNFTGCARVLGAAMPILSSQEFAHIVLIGSLAGLRGLPGAQGYGASKAGVIHMAEQLRVDLPSDRFKVQVINPGFIETRLTNKNSFNMPFIMTPEEGARQVVRAMTTNRFRTHFPVRFSLLFQFLSLLPDAIYTALLRRLLK